MKKGILGKKEGMTQVFTKSGKLIPVTVVSVEPNIVTQIKTKENDGYEAVQLGFQTKREKLATKASLGQTKKANTAPKRFFKEIRGVEVSNYQLGQEIKADLFEIGEVVDVTGTTKGKGFQGTIKRHNQSRGPMTHGSRYHRGPGSMGTLRPMRVFKGKKLPGHMGAVTVTIQNLEIVAVDLENNLILIKGNIPGSNGSVVIIKSSVKTPGKINKVEELNSFSEILAREEVTEEISEEVNEETLEPIAEDEVETNEETSEPEIEEVVAPESEEVSEEVVATEEETTETVEEIETKEENPEIEE